MVAMKNESARKLTALTNILLNDAACTWLEKRNAALDMAKLFALLGGYDLGQTDDQLQQLKHNEVILDSGHAVSTWSAAMCLLEIRRTAVFVKGIVEAIHVLKERLTESEMPLHILDAGCGPFSLLSVLASLYVEPKTVRFHLIDIIPENIERSKQLITQLGLSDYFGEMFITDATRFTWDADKPLHMVISETMLNALRKEPQVAVTLNLARQLSPQGIFIPERIDIALMQVDGWKRQTFLMQPEPFVESSRDDFERKLADIMQLERSTANFDTLASLNSIELIQLRLPDSYDPAVHSLELYTTIQVFGIHRLQYGDCSLTLPYPIARPFKDPLRPGDLLEFKYEISSKPGIRFSIRS